jgi:hypothetical protein
VRKYACGIIFPRKNCLVGILGLLFSVRLRRTPCLFFLRCASSLLRVSPLSLSLSPSSPLSLSLCPSSSLSLGFFGSPAAL